MDNEIIDSAMSEIADAPVADQAPVQDEAVNEGAEQTQQSEQDSADDRQPLPKAVVNAMARQQRKFDKLYAKYKQLEDKYSSFEQSQAAPKNAEPTEDQFESYSEFLEAKLAHKTQKQIQEALQQGKPSPEEAKQAEFMERRMGEISQVAQKVAKQIPDFTDTIDNYDGFDDLPQNIQTMLLHAENPALAAYNLIKSGRMDALASLPEAMAAAEIIKAQSDSPIRKVSQAPAPTSQVRSAGNTQSLGTASVEDLMKTLIRK